MYDIESIYQATSVEDAIRALCQDPEALVLSGGSDILVQVRSGRLAGCRLVSIHGLPELSGVQMEENGTLRILPCTTFAEITYHPLIMEHVPALGAAVDQAGGPQLRNIGTIGGNVCNGITSADSASTLLTLNAQLEITGPEGVRRLSMEDFYKGPGRVDLSVGELLTAILIAPEDYRSFGGHYIKYAMRNAMDIATLGCAVHVRLQPDKNAIQEMRLAFGVAAPTPIRCRKAEALAAGAEITQSLLEQVGQAAQEEINPRTSWRASAEFRQHLAAELSSRALKTAIINGGGNVQ